MATPERGSNAPSAASAAGRGRPNGPPREAPRRNGSGRPDDHGPPPPRRNYPLAIILALIVFALLIGVRVLSGGMNPRHIGLGGALEGTPPPSAPAPSN